MALKVLFGVATVAALALARSDEGRTIQGRGMDEGPWSMMSQQPEVLIVKEKGGVTPNGGGMSMKDLTPIICLLAPLLLAAILIPAKMTMMMNNMMGNGGGGMFPMLPMIPMLPNGMLPMLPGGMLPGGMIPGLPGLTGLLTSGSNSLQLPIFKDGMVSKEFAGKEFEDDKKTNITLDSHKDCKGKENCKKGHLNSILGRQDIFGKGKRLAYGGQLKEESRVGSERKNQVSLANDILKLIEKIERAL